MATLISGRRSPTHVERGLDRWRDAGGVEGGVDAVAVGAVGDQCRHVQGCRVEGARTEGLDRLAPGFGGLDDIDLGQAHPAQGEPETDADRPGTIDQCITLLADFPEDSRVVGHRHRLHQRAHLQRHGVGQLVHLVAGHHGVLRHAAVGHQAVESDDVAQVVLTRLTWTALTAAINGFDGDVLPLVHVGHPLANPGDYPRELVPNDQRHVLAGKRMRVGRRDEDGAVVVLMQVGAADPIAADLHLDLAVSGRGLGNVLDLEVVIAVVDGSAHGSS